MKKLTNAQKELIRPSAFMLDVDFVPNERKDYEDLPEPYRTELLRLYDQRTPGWFNDESKNRLNSFK